MTPIEFPSTPEMGRWQISCLGALGNSIHPGSRSGLGGTGDKVPAQPKCWGAGVEMLGGVPESIIRAKGMMLSAGGRELVELTNSVWICATALRLSCTSRSTPQLLYPPAPLPHFSLFPLPPLF